MWQAGAGWPSFARCGAGENNFCGGGQGITKAESSDLGQGTGLQMSAPPQLRGRRRYVHRAHNAHATVDDSAPSYLHGVAGYVGTACPGRGMLTERLISAAHPRSSCGLPDEVDSHAGRAAIMR